MNIHEYQAKQLLARYGVAVTLEIPVKSLAEVRPAADKIVASGSAKVVVKSQIHAGGRGKGTFKSGFQGGVKVASSVDEAVGFAEKMFGQTLVTKQTGPEGRQVQTLLIAAGAKIKKEFYLAVLLNRETSRPLIMASTEGGMDIEEVAEKHPEKIFKETIDPAVGIMPYQARKIAAALGLKGDLFNAGVKLITGVYNTWWECDAAMVELNPLAVVELADGNETVVALDAKISLDDNALYRHKDILEMRDLNEEAPLEIEASARRQHRLPCQWRGPGDGHDGHHPALRLQPGELPRRRRRREQGAGHGGVQDHFERPEREGHPREHFRRHHGLQRHRHRHRRGGEGNRLETPARRPARRQQRRRRQKNFGRIRRGHHHRRFHGRRGTESCQSGWEIIFTHAQSHRTRFLLLRRHGHQTVA
jgi:hypothetical protein